MLSKLVIRGHIKIDYLSNSLLFEVPWLKFRSMDIEYDEDYDECYDWLRIYQGDINDVGCTIHKSIK